MFRVMEIIKAPKEVTVLSYVSFHYLNILQYLILLSFLCYGDMLIFSDSESRDQEKGTYPGHVLHGSFSVF